MSQVAFISDVHANIDALDAVWADLDQLKIGLVICLGDVVGYGAAPEACVRRVLERCLVTVMGNHEAMLTMLPKLEESDLGATVRVPLVLAAQQLSADQLKTLRTLPLVGDFPEFAIVHSSLHSPESFPYIEDRFSADQNFAAQEQWPVSFHGHTHQPRIWEKRGGEILAHPLAEKPFALRRDSQYSINVGSVGQPRDHDPRACYTIFDIEDRLVLHRRVEYNIQMARTRIVRAKLPANNSLRLEVGQ